MTEYRALTQGGCIAGSQNFTRADYANQSWNFTVPVGVTKLKFTGITNDKYLAVTPGTTYTIYFSAWTQGSNDTEMYGWSLNSTKITGGYGQAIRHNS